MWDVLDVGCAGCRGCGMFGMWDLRDVGCGIFAEMLDVDLQNALSTEPSGMTPLWISTSRNPAAENLLLRICMNIIRM